MLPSPAMNGERFQQACSDFLRAVERLQEALAQPPSPFIRDAVVKRFEFCWELAWKAGRGWLETQGVQAGTPRAVFEALLAAGILADGNRWSHLQRLRNLTTHTYDEALAEEVVADLRASGIADFEGLAARVRAWRP